MTTHQDDWIEAGLDPARQLEPTQPEITAVLARVSNQAVPIDPYVKGTWHRRMTYSRRTITVALIALLLIATATIAAVTILPLDQGSTSDRQQDGGDGPPAQGEPPEPPASENAPAENRQEREQVREQAEARHAKATLTHVYDSLRNDGERVYRVRICELMTEEAKKQMRHYARIASGRKEIEWTCATSAEMMVELSKKSGSFAEATETRVVEVNVKGDKATAALEAGDGSISSLPMVKENGEWKIPAAPTGPPQDQDAEAP